MLFSNDCIEIIFVRLYMLRSNMLIVSKEKKNSDGRYKQFSQLPTLDNGK